MGAINSLVILKGSLEILRIYISYVSFSMEKTLLKVSFISKLVSYKFAFAVILIGGKHANIFIFSLFKLLLPEPMPLIISPIPRVSLLKVLKIAFAMRKPILNIPLIVRVGLNKPPIPIHIIAFPISLIITTIIKYEDTLT
jgi:hypothetical protein